MSFDSVISPEYITLRTHLLRHWAKKHTIAPFYATIPPDVGLCLSPMDSRTENSPAKQSQQNPQNQGVAGPDGRGRTIGVEPEEQPDEHDNPE